MKIGVIDTDAEFKHQYFQGKSIQVVRFNPGIIRMSKGFPLTHAEYVCASILFEYPEAEIILHNIVGEKRKKTGDLLYNSIQLLLDEGVSIINISAGVENVKYENLEKICSLATKNNVMIVAAHSNDESIAYPASFSQVLGVRMSSKIGTEHYLTYNRKDNDVVFQERSFVPCIHLGNTHLLQGNSYLAAKITGLISSLIYHKQLNSDQEAIEYLLSSRFSEWNDSYMQQKDQQIICLTNRKKDEFQILYCKQVWGCDEIIHWKESLSYLEKNQDKKAYDVCVVDIDNYIEFTKNQEEILYIIQKISTRVPIIFMRYTHMNLIQRIQYYEDTGVYLYQLFV